MSTCEKPKSATEVFKMNNLRGDSKS
jgi:hypothetical protein